MEEKKNIDKEELVLAKFERKTIWDIVVKVIFLIIAIICSASVIFIFFFLLYKGIVPFVKTYSNGSKQNFGLFFTNSVWSYTGNGGMPFLFFTTLYSTLLSLILSVPTSIFTALFIEKRCPKYLKPIFNSGIELLASIPSVIFGLFGLAVLAPLIRSLPGIGELTSGGLSILTASLVLAMMTVPTITMLSSNAIKAVSKDLTNASIALGATTSQTNMKVVLKSAQSGIFAGIILGVGRALGEATAVQMVIGNNPVGTQFYNPFTTGNTLTSAMLSGIGEATANSIGYDVRFSLGLVLVFTILIISIILNRIKDILYAKQVGLPRKKFFSFLSRKK